MIKKLFSLLQATLILTTLALAFPSCGDKNGDTPDNPTPNTSEIKVTVPATIDVVKGESYTFSQENSSVKVGDQIYLQKDGKIQAFSVTDATATTFSILLPATFESGKYTMILKTGDRRVTLGEVQINMVKIKIIPEEGVTIYGLVEDENEKGIAGVVVSDGVTTTVTNDKGVYQLKSDKQLGYVFISVPSGYECKLNGVFPDHFRAVNSTNTLAENQSFQLKKVDQSKYKVLFLGDMHVANRSINNDLNQFKPVAADINKYAQAQKTICPVYAITLGDMTWDLYWYSQKFAPADYTKTINECITCGLPIYHTIGNHDNDMRATGNLGAKRQFATNVAPPYYSFNIGGVHYIMLDNVDCSSYIGDESRNHTEGKIYDPQWDWLAKDLSYVPTTTPICVMMHVPVFACNGINSFAKNMQDADRLINALAAYRTVHYVTGHTHRSYNIVPENAITGGKNIYEHNLSALCSDWWWSGNLTPGLLQATDGTPSGYGVWDITGNGADIKWIYKCSGKDENFQFRSYDLNNVKFSMDDVPNLTNASMRTKYSNIIAAYNGAQNNEVLINAWQKNSRWTVSVKTAAGQELTVKEVSAYDPIQIFACTQKRFNDNISSEPIGTAQNRHHFFKVTAPDADTDLVITVKDEFGHTWTENMERPKKFDKETYKIDIK